MSRPTIKHEDSSLPAPASTTTPSSAGGDGVGYTDYILRAPAPSEWRYNMMKFNALGERSIDPSSSSFLQPVKLNRKNPLTVRRLTEDDRERINLRALAAAAKAKAEAEAAAKAAAEENGEPMDTDTKAEEGAEGDVKPVKAEKEQIDLSLVGAGLNGVVPVRSKSSMFKKGTKRVFVTSEEARRLKREEYMPWVLEDDEGNERWVGALEGGTGSAREGKIGADGMTDSQRKAHEADQKGTGVAGWRRSTAPSAEAGGGGSSYVAFVVGDSGEEFQVIPVGRWYKFSQGPNYLTLNPDEAENHYEQLQKSTEDQRWVMRKRIEAANSGASTPTGQPAASSSRGKGRAPEPQSIRSRLLANSEKVARMAAAPEAARRAGSGMKLVNKGAGRGNGDDELRGRRGKAGGDEQGDDEFDYEEDFQDDEEGIATIDDLADEDETKELEERIKREMRGANNIEEVPEVDESEDEALTGTGKEMRKLVRRRDKTGAYDSDNDDDLNPYASGDESDDGASSIASHDPNEIPEPAHPLPRLGHLAPDTNRPRSQNSTPSNRDKKTHSRHGSTSNSRSGSPAPGSTSGSALIAKRATSPARSRGSSPGPGSSAKSKRKRGEEGSEAGEKRKRERSVQGTPEPDAGGDGSMLLTEADVVRVLKTKERMATKDVLHALRKQLKAEPRNKQLIGGLLQAVAKMEGGVLTLKPGL